MLAKTHLVGGAAAGVAAAHYLPHEPALLIGAAVLGSLLPDICHSGSTIGRKAPLLANIVSAVFGHRTFTHSILAMALIAWGLSYLNTPPSILWGLLAGYGSHILLDAMTRNGVKVLWPLPVTLKLPPFVRTGGTGEWIVLTALTVGTIYWGMKIYL